MGVLGVSDGGRGTVVSPSPPIHARALLFVAVDFHIFDRESIKSFAAAYFSIGENQSLHSLRG